MYTGPHAGGRAGQAYDELKRMLLLGELALNVRLGEERLAAHLGVSRTPVREALFRLHAEGLVRRGTDGGFEPVAPDVVVVSHLYEVRAGLEIQAMRRPGGRGQTHDGEALAALRDEWRELLADPPAAPDPAFVLLDEGFHVTLAEAAGNPALADMLRQVNERIRVVRMQDFLTGPRIVQTIDEHLGIVEAVLAGDVRAAEARFTAHLDRSLAVVDQRVNQAIVRMVTGGLW